MPRGIPNPKAPAPAGDPAPMIFVEPLPDGAIRINAYSLDAGQTIDALRRTLLHLVATNAGATVISHTIPRDTAILAAHKPPVAPSLNGHSLEPAPDNSRVLVAAQPGNVPPLRVPKNLPKASAAPTRNKPGPKAKVRELDSGEDDL